MFRTMIAAVVCAALVCQSSADASVMTYGFYNISNNSGISGSFAGQLHVDVWDSAGANSAAFTSFYSALGYASVAPVNIAPAAVLFVYRNTDVIDGSISEIYLDDGTILDQYNIFNTMNVGGFTDFDEGANPGNLPGGETLSPAFEATGAFSADAQGNPSQGVDTNQDLVGISYTLIGGQNYSDTLNALANGDLRIGLHVRSIGDAGGPGNNQSDAFVHFTAVPEPGSVLVWGMGLVGLAIGRGNRRSRKTLI